MTASSLERATSTSSILRVRTSRRSPLHRRPDGCHPHRRRCARRAALRRSACCCRAGSTRAPFWACSPAVASTCRPITFGIPGCDDEHSARAMARVLHLPHRFLPLAPDYLAHYAAKGVRLTDGQKSVVHFQAGGAIENAALGSHSTLQRSSRRHYPWRCGFARTSGPLWRRRHVRTRLSGAQPRVLRRPAVLSCIRPRCFRRCVTSRASRCAMRWRVRVPPGGWTS